MKNSIAEEVEQNTEVFRYNLSQLMINYKGKFILMRHQEIIEFFDTGRDAYFAGRKLYAHDQLFSVHEVLEPPQLWGVR